MRCVWRQSQLATYLAFVVLRTTYDYSWHSYTLVVSNLWEGLAPVVAGDALVHGNCAQEACTEGNIRCKHLPVSSTPWLRLGSGNVRGVERI